MARRRDRFTNTGTYGRALGPDRPTVTLYQPREIPIELVDRVVVVEATDRLDLIAWRTLGEPSRWWRLADANPTRHPDGLMEPGRVLDVPVED